MQLDVSDDVTGIDTTASADYDADLTVGPNTVTNKSLISFTPDNVVAGCPRRM